MRIGIHTAPSCDAATAYARKLIVALQRRLSPADTLVTFDGRQHRVVSGGTLTEFGLGASEIDPGHSRFLAVCRAGLRSDRMLARYSREVDVSHTIGHVAAPVSGVDTIPLLTDLGAVLSPGSSDAAKSSNLERLCRQITKYPAISTVSEFARAELIAAAGCDPARVVVIPPGVDEAFRLGERAEDDFELQAIGLLPQQFFLHTSAPSEGDNLAMLLLAYSNLPAPIRAWLPLVVVGGRLRQRVALPVSVEADIEAGNIRLMSAQPAFLLRILYQKARLTLFPAMHEGFGLALAEALVCGASVVVSEGSANANIAGPRAIKLNPSDVWAWRGALVDQVDRGAHGIHRVSVSESDMSQFSWDRSAETALSLYRRVLEREHEFA